MKKKILDERWEEIIEKAIAKGYNPFWLLDFRGVVNNTVYWWGDNQDGVLSLEKVIFCHDFARALWGEGFYGYECDCQAIPSQKHKKTCKHYICPHCKMNRDLVNPSGYCNHVHYPECCRVCKLRCMSWKDHLQKLVLADDYLEYIEETLKEDL